MFVVDPVRGSDGTYLGSYSSCAGTEISSSVRLNGSANLWSAVKLLGCGWVRLSGLQH